MTEELKPCAYIVMDWDGDAYIIDAAFSTLEKARSYIDDIERRRRLKNTFDSVFRMKIETCEIE